MTLDRQIEQYARQAAWIAGFVAGDGTFTKSGSPPTFTFAAELGFSDYETCQRLRSFFGVGSVLVYSKRKEHYEDEAKFQVRALGDLINIIIPFMDEHLPPSYKRDQYLGWKAALLDYWENHAKRIRTCTVEGCDSPRRAHGLCRQHLYAAGLG